MIAAIIRDHPQDDSFVYLAARGNGCLVLTLCAPSTSDESERHDVLDKNYPLGGPEAMVSGRNESIPKSPGREGKSGKGQSSISSPLLTSG